MICRQIRRKILINYLDNIWIRNYLILKYEIFEDMIIDINFGIIGTDIMRYIYIYLFEFYLFFQYINKYKISIFRILYFISSELFYIYNCE